MSLINYEFKGTIRNEEIMKKNGLQCSNSTSYT